MSSLSIPIQFAVLISGVRFKVGRFVAVCSVLAEEVTVTCQAKKFEVIQR